MTKVVGVRFRQVGKIYFFAPGKYSVETGQHIIVETARGVEYGQVVLGEREVRYSGYPASKGNHKDCNTRR
jgi:cell fate regulator YaaT (PSP1 superfamily)